LLKVSLHFPKVNKIPSMVLVTTYLRLPQCCRYNTLISEDHLLLLLMYA